MSQKRDVVYLYTFPTVPHVYNISPFAMKVESYLRVNRIPYEMVYTSKFGKKGQIPYVKLNDEEIDDSNVIIPHLKQHFEIQNDDALTTEERATAHAVMRMLEEHTNQIGFYYRYSLHMKDFSAALQVPERMFNARQSFAGRCIASAWCSLQPGWTKKKMKARGLAHHTDSELWKFSFDDLRALSDLLGTKTYFHGDAPHLLDCVVFGHLSQFVFIPLDFPQKKFLEEECKNLTVFVEHFRDQHWPDWEQLCSGDNTKSFEPDCQIKPEALGS